MKLTTIFISLVFCFNSCTNQTGIKRIKRGDLILEGAITIKESDTIFNGEIKYYDRNNKLVSKIHFLNGQKNGSAVNFHPNGAIREESNYVTGLINGFRFTCNLNGEIESKDYYYYGVRIGPSVVYENGIVKEYYFSDFEGHTLFSSSYDSLGNLKEKSKEYFYLTALKGQYDSKSGLFLFLYLLNPPKMKLDYRLYTKDSLDSIIDDVEILTKRGIFIKPFLPDLPNNKRYFISLDIYDSTNKSRQVITKDIR